MTAVGDAVADAFREEWGRVVATLIAMTNDWDLAEECTQEAFAQALKSWPVDGVPRRPGAWLTTVARRRALDRLRRKSTEATKLHQVGVIAALEEEGEDVSERSDIADDRLRLIFTCCHPALPLEARTALTLRTLTGLTTAEIAHAFLVPEATMAKRLVRAKQKIAHAGIPYRVPEAALLPARTSGVLAVLYLLFNEGYGASGGADLMRHDLAAEAIAICRVLATLLPEEPEVSGLLALMLFQDARRDSRLDADGEIVTLEHQDRTRWNRPMIDEASALLAGALARQNAGPYQLQAAIASGHATSEAGSTDWVEIARLYALLARIMQSPVVELNRAVAVAMADGPDAGLALLDELETEGSLARYYLLPASRADLLRRLGRHAEAARCYEQALAMAPTEPERRFLRGRMAEMTALP